MVHGYENTPVEDIRRILVEKYGITDPVVIGQTKKPLIELLLRHKGINDPEEEINEFDDVLEDAQEDGDSVTLPVEEDAKQKTAIYNSPEWQEYIMRQFVDTELIDGNPTYDGCRRVVEIVLGPIINSEVKQYSPSTIESKGTATVVYALDIFITNESHPLVNQSVHIEDIADVGPLNTLPPYSNHPSATASTRAEGRCLRKILRLTHIITAEESDDRAKEEVTADDWAPDDPIADNQIQVIDMMCKRLNINVMQFVNSGLNRYASINNVPKSIAQRMLQELNKIQRKIKPSPATVGFYDSEWRTAIQ